MSFPLLFYGGDLPVSSFFESPGLYELSGWTIVTRISLATVFSGALGIERPCKRRAAGFALI